ncbi:MAG: tRNA (N(6)-L-threonylcarbamoyladenosine(37)-C(2))-methylthiotransferase MtaB [Clostridia bacterium]|nr:tRNA (N(6)-L-threonylcarbamoyladenosine(37)-C(2))-methylthiotransferase MtaB [Clostridia bacterium]
MSKVAFYTLGCKVNQYETEAMSELFTQKGYDLCDFDGYSDIYVINTCTVTSMSDRKSRQIIRRAKKHNPNSLVVVTGCYAQTNPEAVLKIEDVNLVIGTSDRKRIVELCEGLTAEDHFSCVNDIMKNHEFENLSISTYHERTRAYIKIQEGCNQFCSYCIIPYARGPIRSREEKDVLEETKIMVNNGYTEIVYAGIHVASYGLDRGKAQLSELLCRANEINGIKRIRLSSIEPMTLNEEFIESIKDCDRLCNHFHLSLQSGCDETLKRMNRKYTTAQYKKITDGLRKHFPDIAITTDIMTGFPGETEEEFEKTVEFVKEIHFADAHIFQYSPRNGTPAAKRTDQIPPEIKEKRSRILIDLCAEMRDEFISSFIGKTLEVQFEQRRSDGLFEGKTTNYITVAAPSDENIQGKYFNVLIESTKDGIAYGKIKII